MKNDVLSKYRAKLEEFETLNDYAAKNGVVLFGSTFASKMPIAELKQYFSFECDIYNRSIEGMTVSEASELVDKSVLSISPKKVFLVLGEIDEKNDLRIISQVLSDYENIINKIKATDKRIEIVLVSVCNENAADFNEELKKLSAKTHCEYADISSACLHKAPFFKAFGILKSYMRDRMTFTEAMNLITV